MKIFLLEDDDRLSAGIKMALERDGYEVKTARLLSESKKILEDEYFSLLILDINLPDGSGLDCLRRRKNIQPHIPVIILTANDMEIDEVTGLDEGADDYITKPFSLAVFRARVRALLRLYDTGIHIYRNERFAFNFSKMEYVKDGKLLDLTKTEQRLLRTFVENRGAVIKRERIIDRVWPESMGNIDENALSVAVNRLRTKIEDDPSNPEYILTVHGIGYRWDMRK